MTPTASTHSLTLTATQADYLLRLVTIAELAIGEHHRTGSIPPLGQSDTSE